MQLFGCSLRLSAGLAAAVHSFCGEFFWVFCCARGLVVAVVAFRVNSHMWLLVWVFLCFLLLGILLLPCLLALCSCVAFWLGFLGSFG